MKDFSNKVIDKIKTEEMRPKPKWQFKFRELSKWAILGVFVIFLGLVSALLWYFLDDIGLRLSYLLNCPLVAGRGLILIIITLSLITFLSMLWTRLIKGSYRYSLILIAISLLIFTSFLAVIFNGLGYGKKLDKSFSAIPFYQNQTQFVGSVWQQPNKGRIAGEIIKIEGPASFIIKDLNNKEWTVSSLNAVWRHDIVLEIGLRVKIIGSQLSDFAFEASDIRSFKSKNERKHMRSAYY